MKNLENIGNIEYKHEPRTVVSGALVGDELQKYLLKHYEMYKINEPLDNLLVVESVEFLENIFKKAETEKHSGLGFAILSENMLNVAMWDKEYPTVLRNNLYIFDNANIESAKPADIRKFGAFCIWELAIVDFERKQWLKYLQSKKTEEDKLKYLNAKIDGLLEIS